MGKRGIRGRKRGVKEEEGLLLRRKKRYRSGERQEGEEEGGEGEEEGGEGEERRKEGKERSKEDEEGGCM